MNKLAIFGGPKSIKKTFKLFNTYDIKEQNAAVKVIKSGIISDFVGKNVKNFYGGKYVREFEKQIKKKFKCKYALTVNSWTSGLIAAIGSIEIEPGDEVILSPFTMSACAISILHWNAIPVFVDIEKDTFCIDPNKIEEKITKRTKAIMVIDIFGHPAQTNKIMKIAKKYNLKVIVDAAQSPGSKFKEKYSGTLGDIGGYSLNFHKHIHTGEGGIIVTNNRNLFERCARIRNHAENVVNFKSKMLTNMLGFNFRLTEIQAAIGIQQLKKLDKILKKKRFVAKKLIHGLKNLKGLCLPITRKHYTHSYYNFALRLDTKIIKVPKKKIFNALKKEGVPINDRYENIYHLPIFQKKIAYGSRGFPWVRNNKVSNVSYRKGICPIAEKLISKEYLSINIHKFDYSKQNMEEIINAFRKVWKAFKLYE